MLGPLWGKTGAPWPPFYGTSLGIQPGRLASLGFGLGRDGHAPAVEEGAQVAAHRAAVADHPLVALVVVGLGMLGPAGSVRYPAMTFFSASQPKASMSCTYICRARKGSFFQVSKFLPPAR